MLTNSNNKNQQDENIMEDIEAVLIEICKNVLDLEQVDKNEILFNQGATSMDVVEIARQLEQRKGEDIPVLKLFEYPSINLFTGYLKQENDSAENKEQSETKEKGKNRVRQRMDKKRGNS